MDMSDMFQVFRKEVEWAGRKLVLETGKIARQADGAVLATYGGTTVLAAVVFEKQPKPGLDFFPLTVNYQEKAFAAGKIPGGFFKREGRPSEKEGHRSFQPVIDAIIQLAEHCAKDPLPLTEASEVSKMVAVKLKAEVRAKLAEAYTETQKLARQAKVAAVKTEAKKLFEGNDE